MFSAFGNPLKIVNLGRSRYFVQFERMSEAQNAKKRLDNFFIRDIKANISIKFCEEDPTLPDPVTTPIDTFRSVFEIRVPLVEFFDHQSKIKGVQNYNIDRCTELANRDIFHGDVRVSYEDEQDFIYDERMLQ